MKKRHSSKETISDAQMPLMGKRLYHIPLDCDAEHPDRWILVGDPGRVDTFNEKDKLKEFKLIGQNREFRLAYGQFNGTEIAVLSTGIGMGPTDIAMNELRMLRQYDPERKVWLESDKFGPLKIIRVGTSGTPSRRIPIPSIAISDYSIGFDNVGSKYEFEPEDQLVDLFEQANKEINGDGYCVEYVSRGSNELIDKMYFSGISDELDIPQFIGITASSASFYAGQERAIGGLDITTDGLVDKLNNFSFDNQRVINWEMETSLIFRLSQIFGYEAGSVCAVLGNRITREAVTGGDYIRSVDAAALTALQALTI